MPIKPKSTAKPFDSITLLRNCPFCNLSFPSRDAWLLHVGLDHTEMAIRMLSEAGIKR